MTETICMMTLVKDVCVFVFVFVFSFILSREVFCRVTADEGVSLTKGRKCQRLHRFLAATIVQ